MFPYLHPDSLDASIGSDLQILTFVQLVISNSEGQMEGLDLQRSLLNQ